MSCQVNKVKFRGTQYPHHKNQHIPEKSGITFPMPSTHSHVNSISDLATGNGNDATPFSQQSVVLTKQAYIELTWQANDWQAQHARSVEREATLTAKVASLEATIRDLTQRLYGTKSEKSADPDDAAASKPSRPRHRGQQPGSKGHGRSDRSALLVVPEVHDLSPAQSCCPACGEAFAPLPGANASPQAGQHDCAGLKSCTSGTTNRAERSLRPWPWLPGCCPRWRGRDG